MIFGGRLTSVLVCQSCKHISHTYEDFNDLSLSIKPEDYVRERKRDRLKNFAKRLTGFPALNVGMEMQRSSSLPPSPGAHAQVDSLAEPPLIDTRRRSVDIINRVVQHEHEVSPTGPLSAPLPPEPPASSNGKPADTNEAKREKKSKKHRSDDSWVKVGRRISMTVGLARTKERRKKEREEEKAAYPQSEGTASSKATTASISPSTPRTSLSEPPSPEGRPGIVGQHPPIPPSPPRLPSFNGIRPPSRSSIVSSKSFTRPKPSRPPKPSAAELKYLQRILADVPPANSNPFGIFRPPHHGASISSVPSTAASMWTKMGQVMGVEECLRLFTAVEVLDGENSVGCRRCWKIENGVYVPRHRSGPSCEDDHEEEDTETEDESERIVGHLDVDSDALSPLTPPFPAPLIPTSLSSPMLAMFTHPNLSDTGSVASLPTSPTSTSEPSMHPASSPRWPHAGPHSPRTPGGLPIPSISTTAPDSPVVSPATARAITFPIIHSASPAEALDNITTPSSRPESPSTPVPPGLIPRDHRESLQAPPHRRSRQSTESDTTDDSSDGEQSDASTASAFSNASSPSFTSASTHIEPAAAPLNGSVPTKKPKAPKPVLMRPAYKRYLIAAPPPVLVIHLKRFQQISKSHIMSFSHGFKKLDDFVTFPEFLNLTPFLAPRKEDFGLGKQGKEKEKDTNVSSPQDQERCVYRLYAVVVHIGNMLGGHYVAYTALPNPNASSSSPEAADPASPPPKRQWAYISDTVVRLTTLEEVLKAKAYLCMYERL
ncbi:hypothetical protein HGRIS_000251 [Hohenbuehelia grisea]|uniref:ubiquitinyl hydrolase 1 n=1 Tax=Hohenbuehelia grisea TaxID=104357 RepID=A0ABR3JS21_9AGAR